MTFLWGRLLSGHSQYPIPYCFALAAEKKKKLNNTKWFFFTSSDAKQSGCSPRNLSAGRQRKLVCLLCFFFKPSHSSFFYEMPPLAPTPCLTYRPCWQADCASGRRQTRCHKVTASSVPGMTMRCHTSCTPELRYHFSTAHLSRLSPQHFLRSLSSLYTGHWAHRLVSKDYFSFCWEYK